MGQFRGTERDARGGAGGGLIISARGGRSLIDTDCAAIGPNERGRLVDRAIIVASCLAAGPLLA